MSDHRAFFGDGEKVFAFPSRELIEELERKTGQGVGALFRRFRQSDYSFSDVTEIIRLGLIGGGTAPAEADRLVSVYAIGRPLAEVFEVDCACGAWLRAAANLRHYLPCHAW
ncbi:gene transfer agent family protein [Neorhizobium alkalisoli]|uniref:gene transfer agent family protein n=1 Tax=Neorhizobium alkalisoli TaxID=528178 RepID=UPI000CF87F48|nr:gene transfer agent family protein [Neorhizobium alkalisoli]